jgi:hypothetical protein
LRAAASISRVISTGLDGSTRTSSRHARPRDDHEQHADLIAMHTFATIAA